MTKSFIQPSDDRGKTVQRQFMDGFAFIQRDVLLGYTPDESFDLSTSVEGASNAFHDGAMAAKCLYAGDRRFAEKLARAYEVKLPS